MSILRDQMAALRGILGRCSHCDEVFRPGDEQVKRGKLSRFHPQCVLRGFCIACGNDVRGSHRSRESHVWHVECAADAEKVLKRWAEENRQRREAQANARTAIAKGRNAALNGAKVIVVCPHSRAVEQAVISQRELSGSRHKPRTSGRAGWRAVVFDNGATLTFMSRHRLPDLRGRRLDGVKVFSAVPLDDHERALFQQLGLTVEEVGQ